MNKVDHVFTHWRSMNSIHKTSVFEPCIFRFNLFDDLFPEGTYLRRTSYRHVFIALVPKKIKIKGLVNHSWCSTKGDRTILTDSWLRKMLRFRPGCLYWDQPRIWRGRKHSADPYRKALSNHPFSQEIYHIFVLHLQLLIEDRRKSLNLLYGRRDAYDTEKNSKKYFSSCSRKFYKPKFDWKLIGLSLIDHQLVRTKVRLKLIKLRLTRTRSNPLDSACFMSSLTRVNKAIKV